MTTSPAVGHSQLADRKDARFDANLELRDTDAAAITTVAGTYAAPDYSSDAVTLGNGNVVARCRIYGFQPTLNADNTVTFIVLGTDDAGTTTQTLAEYTVGGASTLWGGSAAFSNTNDEPLDIMFETVPQERTRYTKVKLQVICAGTADGFTTGAFGAFIAPLPRGAV